MDPIVFANTYTNVEQKANARGMHFVYRNGAYLPFELRVNGSNKLANAFTSLFDAEEDLTTYDFGN